MSGLTVICIENKDEEQVKNFLKDMNIPSYTLEKFFDIERFKTLEEAEKWWEGK